MGKCESSGADCRGGVAGEEDVRTESSIEKEIGRGVKSELWSLAASSWDRRFFCFFFWPLLRESGEPFADEEAGLATQSCRVNDEILGEAGVEDPERFFVGESGEEFMANPKPLSLELLIGAKFGEDFLRNYYIRCGLSKTIFIIENYKVLREKGMIY